MTTELSNKTLAEIVNANFRASKVFDKYGLDFCCKGKRTLSEACNEKSLPAAAVMDDLNTLMSSTGDNDLFTDMTNTELIDHIVETHHTYVREHIPLIMNYLFKVSTKHGARYPYIKEVYVLFTQLRDELLHHLKEEEETVFPLIKQSGNNAASDNTKVLALIADMENEHDTVGTLLAEIRKTAKNFEIPPDACNTFRVVLHLLEDFESDVHRHVFKENHVLFQRLVA